MQSYCSWFTFSCGPFWMTSSTMSCRLPSFSWLVSWMYKAYGERHVKDSLILGSMYFSTPIVVHGSLDSACCCSWHSYSLITSREACRFFIAANICSSREDESEISATFRIWESSFKLMIIFEAILLVKRSHLTNGLVHGVGTSPKIFFYLFLMKKWNEN